MPKEPQSRESQSIERVGNPLLTDDKPEKAGFGSVANRVSGWANNMLATAIVIVIAVTLGWGALKMWGGNKESPEASRTNSSTQSRRWDSEEWVALGLSNELIERREFGGTDEEAVELVIDRGLYIAERSETDALPPPTPSETSFLSSIKDQQPRRTTSHGFASYLLDGPVPMVVTVATVGKGRSRRDDQPNDFESARRVVSWGLALPFSVGPVDATSPTSRARWTLFAFRMDKQDSRAVELPGQISLPPNSLETLSIASTGDRFQESGATANLDTDSSPDQFATTSRRGTGGVVGFLTSTRLSDCQEHFDRLLSGKDVHGNHWQGEAWLSMGHGIGRRLMHPRHGQLEIHLDESRGDIVVGLIILTSANETGE